MSQQLTRSELEAARKRAVADLLGPNLRLLFVGINPSLRTAAVGAHFAHPGNRFWPALHRAGLVRRRLDVTDGMSATDAAHVTGRGIGITNLVARPTARADELDAEELRAGAARLEARVAELAPTVVAVAGVTAYRRGLQRPRARVGAQPQRLGGAALWVVPNPSGLNAHETVETLAGWYRRVGVAAGCRFQEPDVGRPVTDAG